MASALKCGGLQELPDDVLALVSAAMTPRDVLMLGATCRKLRELCVADKLWLPHCENIAREVDLHSWRAAMSYESLWRFMRSVRPLIGLWVHQNPELGNLVYVTWGFASVVGCRIIPQELGPSALDTGLLWAPVFEIIGNSDGSLSFFLHGREQNKEYCYPGRLHLSDPDPNVLLLEVEPLMRSSLTSHDGMARSPNSPLSVETSEDSGEEFQRRPSSPSAKVPSKSKKKKKKQVSAEQAAPFHRLGFGDRRRLLELLTPKIALQMPPMARALPFSCSRRVGRRDDLRIWRSSDSSCTTDVQPLADRRARLMWMYNHGDSSAMGARSIDSEGILKTMGFTSASQDSSSAAKKTSMARALNGKLSSEPRVPLGENVNGFDSVRKLGLARFVMSKMKQMVGKNTSEGYGNGRVLSSSSNTEAKRQQLQEFLKQSKSIGLRLHATRWRLNFYRAWPIMHNNQFALYKIPEQKPSEGRDYAGLWGGTFGWPPGRPTPDKPAGKALFCLKISYDETPDGCLLIATKILDGTPHVLHPNGSAMFTAKVDEPSSAVFPWTDKDGLPLDILHVFQGEGIANGYGFHYPGSKPGDLFVDSTGLLAFVWRESRAVLTLRRLDLQEVVENGDRVPALSPVDNFAYLTKTHSNVFTGSWGNSQIGNVAPRSSVIVESPVVEAA